MLVRLPPRQHFGRLHDHTAVLLQCQLRTTQASPVQLCSSSSSLTTSYSIRLYSNARERIGRTTPELKSGPCTVPSPDTASSHTNPTTYSRTKCRCCSLWCACWPGAHKTMPGFLLLECATARTAAAAGCDRRRQQRDAKAVHLTCRGDQSARPMAVLTLSVPQFAVLGPHGGLGKAASNYAEHAAARVVNGRHRAANRAASSICHQCVRRALALIAAIRHRNTAEQYLYMSVPAIRPATPGPQRLLEARCSSQAPGLVGAHEGCRPCPRMMGP